MSKPEPLLGTNLMPKEPALLVRVMLTLLPILIASGIGFNVYLTKSLNDLNQRVKPLEEWKVDHTKFAADSIACHGQNLIVAATNLPGPGYAAWTNFVARYNQAASTNKNVSVAGFNYLQTNIVAAVTNDEGQVIKPATTNLVEVHPRLTSAQLLADFAESAHFKRLCGEALTLYIRDRKQEILDQVESNWWNGVKQGHA